MDTFCTMPTPSSPSLLSLPIEVLEHIASYSVSPTLALYNTKTATGRVRGQSGAPPPPDLANLRLIHPFLTPIFTRAIFLHSTIILNPRNTATLDRFENQVLSTRGASGEGDGFGLQRWIGGIKLYAPNFLQVTQVLSPVVTRLVGSCAYNLRELNLHLDGHFVRLDQFLSCAEPLAKLASLTLQGESLYTNLDTLAKWAPNLKELNILAPTLAGEATTNNMLTTASTGITPLAFVPQLAAPSLAEELSSTSRKEIIPLPDSLTHLQIANLNTPSVASLLLHLPFKPVHFSFSLLHNYDLDELALLLCRDEFCKRTVKVSMYRSRMVAPHRLDGFRRNLELGLKEREVVVDWCDKSQQRAYEGF